MMRILQILLVTFLGFTNPAQAQDDGRAMETKAEMDINTNNLDKTGDTSVGFKWGVLTGIEFKHWYDQKNALVVGFAFDGGNTAVTGDYLWHFRGGVEDVTGLKNTNAVVPYVGAGVLGVFGDRDNDFFDHDTDDFGLAVRAPLGFEFLPRRFSMGIFAEIAPSFGIIPTAVTFMTAEIGARFYF